MDALVNFGTGLEVLAAAQTRYAVVLVPHHSTVFD